MDKEEKLTIYLPQKLVSVLKELASKNGVTVDDIVNGLLLYAMLQGQNFEHIAAVKSDGAQRTH